ncbi:MAG: FAD-dependent oxidoreductase [Myxococcota bacterium]|nr:FAD-dependent oxidoreductase [Myxococcota bacterium]
MSSEYSVINSNTVSSWDRETDVLVVGMGAAGSAASITARETGASVLVLDRASGPGGTTAAAAGHIYMGGGTRVQKAVGIEDTVEDMYQYMLANTPDPDEEKLRLYCEGSVAHFDWLVERGVPFKDSIYPEKDVLQMTDDCLIESGNEAAWPYRNLAKPSVRGHKVEMVGDVGGSKLIEKLVAHAEKIGVEIQYDSAVTALVRDGDRIVGVRCKTFDGEKFVGASGGVVLAAGQFGMNEKMIKDNCRLLGDDRIQKQGSTFDDGAGHQLGAAAGGVLDHMDGALLTSPFYPPQQLIYSILVNKHGKRFINEDVYHSKSSIACLDQPDSVAYLIADDGFFARPAYGWQEVVDAWETVEEMERDLNMPEGSLQKTIDDYNSYAENGDDKEFHKQAKWMKPLANPPFAAVNMSLGEAQYVGFPLGGLRVTKDGEVLREDGSIVTGLFAAGGCASNIAQDGSGYSSGTCIGESTFFGRRTGIRAAAGNTR